MKGVRAIALCGAIILLVTGCEQVNQAKGAVMKVVQRFRGGDSAKADTPRVDSTQVALTMDTATKTAPAGTGAMGTKGATSSKSSPAGAATKTATRQSATGTTLATQQSKTTTTAAGGSRTTPAPATKTATSQPATGTTTTSATKTTPRSAAPAPGAATQTTISVPPINEIVVKTAPARSAARGPRDLTEAEKTALDDLGAQFANEFDLHSGWFRDHQVQYYDFGPTPMPIAPIVAP